MKYKFLLFITVLLSVLGCNVINPVESVPTYIKIDSFDFVINDPLKEGSASNGITSVWVYYNNNPVGNFDLPCNVPVITEGDKGSISVAPGISLNGFVDLQPQYPFYNFDTTTLITNPGKVQQFTPKGTYVSSAKFRYKEDFEVGSSFETFVEGGTIETGIRPTLDARYVYEGGGAGVILLSSNGVTWSESINKDPFDIGAGESYLEINYKCSVPFEVGLYNTLNEGVDQYNYFAGVKSSDTWKKIYIELATYTSANQGKDFKIIIKAVLPDGQSDGYVAIDNIKVVSF